MRPACNFIKNELLIQVFSFEFCEIFNNTFFNGTPQVLLDLLLQKLECHSVAYLELCQRPMMKCPCKNS